MLVLNYWFFLAGLNTGHANITLMGVFYKMLELGFADLGLTSKSWVLLDMSGLPLWLQLAIFFVVLDFVLTPSS